MKPVQSGATRRTFLVLLGLIALLPLTLAGCGTSHGKISGTVTYQGKPVPGGEVIFFPTDSSQKPVPASIDENGHYEASVPAGEAKVAVDNRSLKNAGIGPIGSSGGVTAGDIAKGQNAPPKGAAIGPPKDAMAGAMKDKNAPKDASQSASKKTYVPIPEKYAEADKTDLKITVTGGTQTYNIELK